MPDAWLDRYEGAYDAGWDNLREERLERMESSSVVEPSRKSWAFSLISTGNSEPTSDLTALNTSRAKRARFSRLPPYRSLRRLRSGVEPYRGLRSWQR